MSQEFTPREYQSIIIEHAGSHTRSAVWAGMGMGKTVSALTYIDQLEMQGVTTPKLVLAPLLVAKTSWPDEADKWAHLSGMRVVPVVGSERERRRLLRCDANVFVTNYESIPWLVDYFGERWPFETIIADEATRLKGFRIRQGSARMQYLAQVAHSKVKHLVELTGTPSPNGLKDLWGQMWFLDKGKRLGSSYQSFSDRWFSASRDGYGLKPHDFSGDEINNRIRDLCVTVNPKDWFDLKDPIVVDRYVDLPARAMHLYKEMEEKCFFELEDHEVEAFHAAARTQKLLQIANGAVYVDPLVESDDDPRAKLTKEVHDAKLQALESIIAEANGMPILVSTSFRSDLVRLKKAFPKGEVLTSKNGVELMRRWNEGLIPLLFAHPQSAGHGLNLQYGGNILVYFAQTWNLEHQQQILERIGPVRQLQAGLDRPVFVYRVIARDTVDELVIARTDGKRDVQDVLLEAMARKRRSK